MGQVLVSGEIVITIVQPPARGGYMGSERVKNKPITVNPKNWMLAGNKRHVGIGKQML